MRFTLFKKHSFTSYSDEELIAHISRGSQDALRELYARYGMYLFNYFNKMFYHDEEIAKDFTQDFFLKLEKHAPSFKAQQSAKTWMFTIASNMCKNEWRKNNIRHQHLAKLAIQDAYHQKTEESIDQKTIKETLERALHSLEVDDRNIIALRYQQECSIAEIAAIMNLPEGTVKSRIFYLLKKLRKQINTQLQTN